MKTDAITNPARRPGHCYALFLGGTIAGRTLQGLFRTPRAAMQAARYLAGQRRLPWALSQNGAGERIWALTLAQPDGGALTVDLEEWSLR